MRAAHAIRVSLPARSRLQARGRARVAPRADTPAIGELDSSPLIGGLKRPIRFRIP